jgi:hypothetical protein
MTYSNEIEINLPRERVILLFDNPDNLKEWMPGLISFEPVSGIQGQPGAVSKLKFQMGKRMMEMTETVTVRQLPDEFSGTYEMKNVYNEVKNKFIPLGPDKTKYMTESTFHFKGVMRVFGFLMKGAFIKTSQGYLERFKKFAEEEG